MLVLQGPDKGLRFRTKDGQGALLGRSSPEMPLSDFTVSRRHAELKPTGRGWLLEDLKSANGTYINGKRIERPARLRHGDQVRLGATVMIWDGSDEEALEQGSAGAAVVGDLVDLTTTAERLDASIIGSVGAADDSMILATPAAAEAVRSWRVMSGLLDAIGAVLTPRQLVERTLDLVFQEVPADRGFILMKDPRSSKYEAEAVRWHAETRDKIRASRGIVDHVISNREGILCSNAMSDARFKGAEADMSKIGLQSVICVPLVSREEILGVIYIDCPMSQHIYTEEQLRLVAAIGQMAGLAIEDARLVNERVRTERLAAAGETVSALSHYIKNILQGLMGGSDVLEMGLRGQQLAMVDQGWQVVRRNLDKVQSLTLNMLAFAKQREPRLEPVQLNFLVEDVLKLVARRAEDKGVLLKHEFGEPMPATPMDENGIHQVVLNIVVNAIDAVAKGSGVVTVKTQFDSEGDSVVIAVGDNGPGIPKEMREKIFDAFYSTKGHGGTGLGLAVAKKIVDEHLGNIVVNSVPGQGTVIKVILPVTPKKGIDSAGTHGPATA
jgi:signal transduction histidine kinase